MQSEHSFLNKKFSTALAITLAAFFMLCNIRPACALNLTQNDELLILVNSTHTISADYKPDDLIETVKMAPSKKGSMLLRKPVADAYMQMLAAYKAENAKKLYTVSGYRDYNYQKNLFARKLAANQKIWSNKDTAYKNTLLYTALPGTSEHQTGMAIDLSYGSGLSGTFNTSTQGKWLLNNCWNYGFILRYQEDTTDITGVAFEPWHYRYVGLPHSQIIRDNNWTLEEYIEYLHTYRYIDYPDANDETKFWRINWTQNPAEEFEGTISLSSDNCNGYIVTTQISRVDHILTTWAEQINKLPFLFGI